LDKVVRDAQSGVPGGLITLRYCELTHNRGSRRFKSSPRYIFLNFCFLSYLYFKSSAWWK